MNGFDHERWQQVWREAGLKGDALPWFEKLAAAYGETQRFYHNQRHIAECLGELDAGRQLARNPVAVELSLWFHDAIYDSRAADNEEQSAALASRCLVENGAGEFLIDSVNRLVLATKRHDASLEVDAPLMVDIDLSILGQSEERFREYDTQIRREYAWVPEDVFREKRAEVLEGFLSREHIYVTGPFSYKYETAARHNLQGALWRLREAGT